MRNPPMTRRSRPRVRRCNSSIARPSPTNISTRSYSAAGQTVARRPVLSIPGQGGADPAAAMDAELVENALQVGADRGGFDAKPMGDHLVGQSLANHQRHL